VPVRKVFNQLNIRLLQMFFDFEKDF
jgi:hypothetical protein